MTAPAEQPTAADELQAYLQEHADAVRTIEVAAAEVVIGYALMLLRSMSLRLVTDWVKLFGSTTAPADPAKLGSLLAWMATSLGRIELKPGDAIREHGVAARLLGRRQAREEMGLPRPTRSPRPRLLPETEAMARKADEEVAAHLAMARKLVPKAEDVEHRSDLMPAISAASQAVNSARTAITYAVHHEANAGIADEAAAAGAQLLWLAERDACLHCLAYSGELVKPGASFPAGLTFAERPLKPWPPGAELVYPPLHPHCRCRVVPWASRFPVAIDLTLPHALKREAKRSVVLGHALPSESVPARRRAAGRLLDQGAGLPKTVEAAARRRLRAGTFTTGPVPEGKG